MAQTILHIDQITRASAKVLESSLGFLRSVNRQYDASFAQSGAKIGDTLRVRKPFRPTVRSGRVANVQDYVEEYVNLPVTNYHGIDLKFTSQEMTLALDEFSERVLKPQLSTLASYLDWQAISALWYQVPNIVGTPGTTPANMQVWGDAMAKLDNSLAPRDGNRWAIVDVDAMARTTYGSSTLFHKSSNIADQYANGYVEDAIGLRWMMDQSIMTLTNGSREATGEQDLDEGAGTNLVEGTTTLHMDGFGSATDTISKGEVFTIVGVYDVHPITKQTLPYLKRFTVTADFTAGSNEGDVSFLPAIYTSASGGKQNVSAMPATGADVSMLTGATVSGPYPHSMVHHRDAFIFATADLEMPFSGQASRARAGDISVRVWKQSDIVNDTHYHRLDVLWGTTAVYPEWACRVTG